MALMLSVLSFGDDILRPIPPTVPDLDPCNPTSLMDLEDKWEVIWELDGSTKDSPAANKLHREVEATIQDRNLFISPTYNIVKKS